MKSAQLLEHIYWVMIFFISITKPISDAIFYFGTRSTTGVTSLYSKISLSPIRGSDIGRLLSRRVDNRYLNMAFYWVLFYFCSISVLRIEEIHQPDRISIIFFVGTFFYIITTVAFVKSIVVASLIAFSYATFGMINVYQPLLTAGDISVLNNAFSTLISTLNFFLLAATFAVGIIWKFSRHNDEHEISTISTMFYTIGYLSVNVSLIAFFLFFPLVHQILNVSN